MGYKERRRGDRRDEKGGSEERYAERKPSS
jgi:hypothetical protein